MGKIKIWEDGEHYFVDSLVDVSSKTIYTGCIQCGHMIKEDVSRCLICEKEQSHGPKGQSGEREQPASDAVEREDK